MGTSNRSSFKTAKTFLIVTVCSGAGTSACRPIGNVGVIPIVDEFLPLGSQACNTHYRGRDGFP